MKINHPSRDHGNPPLPPGKSMFCVRNNCLFPVLVHLSGLPWDTPEYNERLSAHGIPLIGQGSCTYKNRFVSKRPPVRMPASIICVLGRDPYPLAGKQCRLSRAIFQYFKISVYLKILTPGKPHTTHHVAQSPAFYLVVSVWKYLRTIAHPYKPDSMSSAT